MVHADTLLFQQQLQAPAKSAAFGCKLLQRLPYQSSIATLMAVTYSAAILRADFCHHQPSFLLTQAADDICSSLNPLRFIRPSPQGLRDSIRNLEEFPGLGQLHRRPSPHFSQRRPE